MCRWGQRRDCEEGEVTHIHIKSKERIEEEEEEEEGRDESRCSSRALCGVGANGGEYTMYYIYSGIYRVLTSPSGSCYISLTFSN